MSVELSVVVPVYNEEANLSELHRRLTDVLRRTVDTYEILLVDDGSCDRSWEMIASLAGTDAHVRGVRFSRNFGHQMAFTAGLDHALGDAVVIMDADLQDPPELIGELLRRHREGFEIVYAVRTSRHGESFFKRFTASVFYRLLRRLTQVDIPVDTGDFRLMGRRSVEAFRRLPERHRFTRGLVAWLGFPSVGVPFERPARKAGETNYPLGKMVRLAVDAITSFSRVPLQLALWMGVAVALVAAACAGVALGLKIAGRPWPVGVLSGAALFFLGGVQLVTIGILGAYLGRVFEEVKGRPLYLVRETAGGDGQPSTSDTAAAGSAEP